MPIGRRIARLREERGLTQEQLAVLARTSRVYITQLETGYRNPGLDMIVRLADAFCVPVDAVLRDAPRVPGPEEAAPSAA